MLLTRSSFESKFWFIPASGEKNNGTGGIKERNYSLSHASIIFFSVSLLGSSAPILYVLWKQTIGLICFNQYCSNMVVWGYTKTSISLSGWLTWFHPATSACCSHAVRVWQFSKHWKTKSVVALFVKSLWWCQLVLKEFCATF